MVQASAAGIDEIRGFMEANGLPGGLLPDGARAVVYDEGTGVFEVALPAKVNRRAGGYKVRYGTTLKGRIAPGRLEDLQGVKAGGTPIWVRVHTIEARGDRLRFGAGPVKKVLPATEFAPR